MRDTAELPPPPTVASAEDLLVDFEQTGDSAPFEEVVRRYSGMVYGVCYRVTRNAHDAEDAAQAVFLKLATQAKTGGVPRVGPWLQQVARTTAVDLRRSRNRRTNREQVKAAIVEQQTEHADATDDLGMDELKQLLRDEVDLLPVHYRTPLVLYYFGGLSTEQIAKELSTNAKALAVRLFRGRKMLGARLKERGLAPLAALGGGSVLTLAVVDAILAAMANASFGSPAGGAAAVYGGGGAAASAGGSGAWLTAHSAVFASILDRVSSVTRTCALAATAGGKWKVSVAVLIAAGTALAGTTQTVQALPAVQKMGNWLGGIRDAVRGVSGTTRQIQNPIPGLRADAPAGPADAPASPTQGLAALPSGTGLLPAAPGPRPRAMPENWNGSAIAQPTTYGSGLAKAFDNVRGSPQAPPANDAGRAVGPVGGPTAGQAVASMGSAPVHPHPAALDLSPKDGGTSAVATGPSAPSDPAALRLFGKGNPAGTGQPVHGPVALPGDSAALAAAATAAPSESLVATGPSQAAGLAGGAADDPYATGVATIDPNAKYNTTTDVGAAGSDFGLPGVAPGIFAGTESGLGGSSMIPTNPDPIPEPTGVAVLAAAAAAGLLARRRRARR